MHFLDRKLVHLSISAFLVVELCYSLHTLSGMYRPYNRFAIRSVASNIRIVFTEAYYVCTL